MINPSESMHGWVDSRRDRVRGAGSLGGVPLTALSSPTLPPVSVQHAALHSVLSWSSASLCPARYSSSGAKWPRADISNTVNQNWILIPVSCFLRDFVTEINNEHSFRWFIIKLMSAFGLLPAPESKGTSYWCITVEQTPWSVRGVSFPSMPVGIFKAECPVALPTQW